MRNWKTTTAGIVAILGALAVIGKGLLGDGVTPDQMGTALTALLAGIIGLAAKDHNVTGGGPTDAGGGA